MQQGMVRPPEARMAEVGLNRRLGRHTMVTPSASATTGSNADSPCYPFFYSVADGVCVRRLRRHRNCRIATIQIRRWGRGKSSISRGFCDVLRELLKISSLDGV